MSLLDSIQVSDLDFINPTISQRMTELARKNNKTYKDLLEEACISFLKNNKLFDGG